MKPQEKHSPQCTTAAQCLKELARVMEQFGIAYPVAAVESRYVKVQGYPWMNNSFPSFDQSQLWQFAIAEVEGKPVFIGDELFYFDEKIVAVGMIGINGKLCVKSTGMNYSISSLSWNPPKPKTVMVELPYDYVQMRIVTPDTTLLREACKLALEKLK